jgi:hypothetical protein
LGNEDLFRPVQRPPAEPKILRFIPAPSWFNSLVPSGNTEQRKLAANMATDMAGYSVLASMKSL